MAHMGRAAGDWTGLFDEISQMPGEGASDLPLDAFMLEGDERTWNLEDWSWDADGLRGIQKNIPGSAPCCEVLQRGRQPIGGGIQEHPVASHCQHSNLAAQRMCVSGPAAQDWSGMQCCPEPPSKPHCMQRQQEGCGGMPGHENMGHVNRQIQPPVNPVVMPVMVQGAQQPTALLPVPFQAAEMLAQPAGEPDTQLFSMWDQLEGAGISNSVAELVSPAPKKPCLRPAPEAGEAKSADTSRSQVEAAIKSADPDDNSPVLHESPEDSTEMVCQVAGCGADLTYLKEYHHRYHICDVHIRLPQVMKEGRLQRFCQQCGRFHDLVAFDANRRSCRDQLLKHNARRRMRTKIMRGKSRMPAGMELSAGEALPTGLDSLNSTSLQIEEAKSGSTTQPATLSILLPAPTPTSVPIPVARTTMVQPEAPKVPTCEAPPGGAPGCTAESDAGSLLAALMQNPAQLNSLRLLLGIQTSPVLPPMLPFVPDSAAHGLAAPSYNNPATYSTAREMIDGRGQFGYKVHNSEHASLRVSMKLFARTPADLPIDMRHHITSWLAAAPAAVEGLIRPGCVFLTLQLLLDLDTYQTAVREGVWGLVKHLLHKTGCMFWREGVYTVQVGTQLASLTNGQVTGYFDSAEPLNASVKDLSDVVPELQSISPICVTTQSPAAPAEVSLRGTNLHSPGLQAVVRVAGKQLRSALSPVDKGVKGSSATISLPAWESTGLAMVEVSRNAYLTQAMPVLVVEDAQIAQEVRTLKEMGLPLDVMSSLLVDLNAVLHPNTYPANSMSRSVATMATRVMKANQLLAFACDHGWSAVAKALMPLAGIAPGYMDSSQLSLLHRAVRSGSLATVQALLSRGSKHGFIIRSDLWGPLGITPLHLSALMPNVKITLALLNPAACVRRGEAFTQLVTYDGVTPFHLALQMGHFELSHVVKALEWTQVASTKGVKEEMKLLRSQRMNKYANEVNPCEVCHSVVPPLMLSISASCYTCGMDRPCLSDDENNDCSGNDEASGTAETSTRGRPSTDMVAQNGCHVNNGTCDPHSMASKLHSFMRNSAVDAEQEAPNKSKCSHSDETLYRIQAMCQGCHVNRELVAT